jgi:hypothetical protein
MTSSESGQDGVSRRDVLKAGGAGLSTLVAGCLGGGDEGGSSGDSDNSGSSVAQAAEDPAGQDSNEELDEDTPTPTPEPDYDTPESRHMDTEELVRDWTTQFSEDERIEIDSHSPTEVYDEHGNTWVSHRGNVEKYEFLPFGHDDIPETMLQELGKDHEFNVVKVDQLPSGASEENLEDALESEGYEKESEVDGFSLYVGDEDARAVGEGMHLLSYNRVGRTDTSPQSHLDNLMTSIEGYRSELPEDVDDLLDEIEMRDKFTVIAQDDEKYFIQGADQPVAGAATANTGSGEKRVVLKFEGSNGAQEAYDALEGRNEIYELDQDGRYLSVDGEHYGETAMEDGANSLLTTF